MLRQAAFIAKNKMLKGALHCHTTRSDGAGDPGDVIRLHKANGYDFMALTDHRRYNYENFAPETDMTIIPGMEVDANFERAGGVHCLHIVCIGPAKEDGNGFEQDQRFESLKINDQLEMQPFLDMIHDNKNMTIYCHPQWSGTPTRDFDKLQGNFAMELWNSGCVIENELDVDNGLMLDDLNEDGHRLWGVAVDDGHPMEQHCNGWVMVNAENNINAILRALKDGAFYASTGPEINDFRIENGKAVVECSPCTSVVFRCGRTPTRVKEDPEGMITSAEETVRPHMPFIRAVVTDEMGNTAWTNPIFLD